MATTGNGKSATRLTKRQREINQMVDRMWDAYRNETLSRVGLGGRLGMQFQGDRDLYATFGYKVTLNYDDYRAMYDRLGMATRLIEKFSNDTWNKPPTLIDGSSRSDDIGETTTPFLTAWNELVKTLKLWQTMREADIMCGIGKYSVIFLGFPGNYSTPVKQGSDTSIFYANAYDEKQAGIESFVKDDRNPAYGMPEFYAIDMADYQGAMPTTRREKVHYTRCIHIAENRLGSRVFGRPRMQEVYNRLMDLEKVTGGGAEAAWLAVYMGFLILTREGVELPAEDTEEWRKANEAMQQFAHRIQRFATLKGVEEVVNLGVHEVRIKDIYGVLVSDLAGSKGIPQRILLGSERGELASTQDMHEWNGVISSRRTNFAEPEILGPFIQKCIEMGVIPAPSSGKWTVEWQPVYAMTEMQEADYVFKIAQAANMLTNGAGTTVIEENEFRGMLHLPPLEPEELDKLEEPEEEETEDDAAEAQQPIQAETITEEVT